MDGTIQPPLPRRWRAGPLVFDERGDILTLNGATCPIEPIPRRLLHRLLRAGGEIVPKEALIAAGWRSTRALSDASFYTAMKRLRTTLGEIGPDLVSLEPGRGYRITPPVSAEPSPAPARPLLTLSAGDPVPGRAQWRLAEPLGEAARRDVWLAIHEVSRERRVFKFAEDKARREALLREVLSARRLREAASMQDGFVAVLDAALEARPAYLELEYGGRDLTTWASGAGGLPSVPIALRIRLLADAAAILGAAHEVGVLHGDLKPGNILVDEDAGETRIRLIDFEAGGVGGPAEFGALSRSLQHLDYAEAARRLGTLPYAAPEMLAEGRPTIAADIYALGVLLYQLIAGDFGRPLTAGWENDVADPLLREDIAAAASGEPTRRLGSAQLLAERLRTLGARRVAAERSEAERRERLALEQEAQHAAARATHATALARRTRRAALALLLLFAVAATSAVAAYHAQQTASAERKRARQASVAARDAVASLIDDITVDMKDREGISQDDLKRSLGRADEIVTRLAGFDPADPALQRLKAHALVQFAPIYKHQGDLAQAQHAAERAADLARRLHGANGGDIDAGLTLARALRWIADVKLKRHDMQGAGAAYGEARDLMAALATTRSRDEEVQLVHARAEEAVGDWQDAQDKHSEALETYRRAEQIMTAGVATFGNDPSWQLEGSVALEKIGDGLSSLGKHEEARAAYERDLAIRQALLARDDRNARYISYVAVALSDIGDEALALHDPGKAAQSYEESLALDQRLVDADPTNLNYRRGLLAAATNLADAQAALGDVAASMHARDLALAAAEALTRRSPDDSGFRQDRLAVEMAAAKTLIRFGRAAEAVPHAKAAQDIARRLAAEHPGEKSIENALTQAEGIALRPSK